jgi:hypothetical protein
MVPLLALLSVQRASAEGASALIAKIDALQPDRDNREKELEGLVAEALAAAPNDYGVLWRAARHHCWIGEGPVARVRREQEAKQCWDLGAKAAALKPDAVEGNYFAAAGAGQYSTEIGIMKALSKGMEGTFNGYLDKAISIDRKFFYAAPLVAKGRYHFSLPWPKRSYSKSVERFKEALALYPNQIRAKLWLAQTLVADGDAKAAQVYIDQVEAQLAAGGAGADMAEVRRVKSWLEPVKTKVKEELQ